jgi:hypothetical protein
MKNNYQGNLIKDYDRFYKELCFDTFLVFKEVLLLILNLLKNLARDNIKH